MAASVVAHALEMPGQMKTYNLADIEVRFLRRYRDPKAVEEFNKSLEAEGQLVPVILALIDGKLLLADGHCRFDGLKTLGRTEIIGTVDARLDSEEKLIAFLFQTETRSGRSVVDFGLHLKAYQDRHGLTQRELAAALKLSESAVSRCLCVFEFPPDVIQAVGTGALTVAHCLAVSPLDDAARKVELLRRALSEGLSAAKLKLLAFPPKVSRSKGLRYEQRGVTVTVKDGVSFAAFKAAVDAISAQYGEKLRAMSKSDLPMNTVLAVGT